MTNTDEKLIYIIHQAKATITNLFIDECEHKPTLQDASVNCVKCLHHLRELIHEANRLIDKEELK